MQQKQEEQEAAIFKNFFLAKVKKISCVKKVKYTLIVLIFALVVSGYFFLSYTRIQKMDTWFNESLNYFEIVSNRDPHLSSMVLYFRESISRGEPLLLRPEQVYRSSDNSTLVSAFQFYIEAVLDNENDYKNLRLRNNIPSIILESSDLISTVEGKDFCEVFDPSD